MSPIEGCANSPFTGAKSPFRGENFARRYGNLPLRGEKSPYRGAKSPLRGSKSLLMVSFLRVGHPTQHETTLTGKGDALGVAERP
eukprot:687371-Pyramimonas_sp.AAC.2